MEVGKTHQTGVSLESTYRRERCGRTQSQLQVHRPDMPALGRVVHGSEGSSGKADSLLEGNVVARTPAQWPHNSPGLGLGLPSPPVCPGALASPLGACFPLDKPGP
ncbi:Gdnf-Inducible Zinc Finger Protein 1 [Manis pentadactyla]|nr:Gdnf-Inducible Zinc Finger Protein 1 [Manis pentadactyla]